jgi:class 3 adenylate cyclase/tetratricopeptide (TPR) repeat protein
VVAPIGLSEILLSYVPEHLALRLAAGDFPLPGRGERLWGVTLFADVSGFTPLSELLNRLGKEGAEKLTSILNGHFARTVEIIEDQGGSVVKFGGDALTVLFPLAEGGSEEQIVEDALECAVRMQRSLAESGRIAVDELGQVVTLRMKVGISCGPMIQLLVGDGDALEFVLAGRPLDEMAESEHRASAGDIVVADGIAKRVPTLPLEEIGDGFFRLVESEFRSDGRPRPPRLPRPGGIAASLLAPFVPRALVEQVESDGGSASVGEHRKVTTIFVAFSGLDYDRDPDALSKLQAYFLGAVSACRRFGGRVNRLSTGDKGNLLHLIFGAPVSGEDDERRALLAALDLVSRPLPFAGCQRMGVNTGSVFCGNVGSDARREYTIMGDAVNVAARLAFSAAEGEIVCSRETFDRTSTEFEFRTLPPIRLKGKSGVHERFAPARYRGERDDRKRSGPRFVGRSGELAASLRFLEEGWSETRGAWIHVEGEAGIGKSRFAEELIERERDRRPGLRLFRARAFSWTRETPYALWADLVGGVLGLSDETGVAERRQALSAAITTLHPDRPEDFELVGRAFGWWSAPAEPDSDPFALLDDEVRRLRLFGAIEAIVLGTRETTVLCLDDLQWVDAASAAFLAFLVRALGEAPVLLLTMRRPGEGPSLPETEGSKLVVRIAPLERPDVEGLLADLFPRGGVDRELIDLVEDRSRGNPLCAVELARHLDGTGAIRFEEETARSYLDPDHDREGTPETVDGLLLARIDALPPLGRRIVKNASVFGRAVDLDVLLEISSFEFPLDRLAAEIAELGGLGLRIEGRGGGRRASFDQPLVQAVAYESLNFESRRELHAAIGSALERRAVDPAELAEQASSLARHFLAARDAPRAYRYSRLAADRALAAFANEEARHHLSTAIDLAPRAEPTRADELLLELLPVRSEVLSRLGLHAEAFADRTATLPRLARGRDWTALSRACYRMSRVREVQSDFRSALALARSATRFALRTDWDEGRIQGICQTGVVLWRTGDVPRSLTTFESLRPGELSGPFAPQLLLSYGIALFLAGRYPEAETVLRRCADLARRDGNGSLEILAATSLGNIYSLRNELDRFEECLDAAERRAKELGDHHQRISILNNRGVLAVKRRRLDEAEGIFTEVVYWARRLGLTEMLAHAHVNLGAIAYERNDFPRALDSYRRAHELFSRLRSIDAVVALANIAETLVTTADPEAEGELRRLVVEASDKQSVEIGIWAETALGKLVASQGRAGEAETLWRRAVAIAEAREMPEAASEAREELAGLDAARKGNGN